MSCLVRGFLLLSLPLLLERRACASPIPETAVLAQYTESKLTEDGAFQVEVLSERYLPKERPQSYSGPASLLTYNPLVELQSRNITEAQSDLVIRGGTFENSGLRLGAAGIYDPQTGHYLLELPVADRMLLSPTILSGLGSGLLSANASVGSAQFQWAPVELSQNILYLGAGDYRTSSAQIYSAIPVAETELGMVALDLDLAHSESQGTRPHGDHIFTRYSGRVQLRNKVSQTDFFVGFQNKFLSWPNLYAPQVLHDLTRTSGVEADELATVLALIHERYESGESYIQLSPYYRRNQDDYEFDRYNPGLFNPYRHTTEVFALNGDGRLVAGEYSLEFAAQSSYDSLESTALKFGKFKSRSIYHASLLPGIELKKSEQSRLVLKTGLSYFGTNRSEDHISPLLSVSVAENTMKGGREAYLEVSQGAQVPGYTALASNPSAGLFRGNRDLGTTISTNYELGVRGRRWKWEGQAAVFYRKDANLVDWTFDRTDAPFLARRASNIDLKTTGFESLFRWNGEENAVSGGYACLSKEGGFERPNEVSFYAFNYPKHRVTVSLERRLLQDLRFIGDIEYRKEEPNLLRGGDEDFTLASVALRLFVSSVPGLAFTLSAENIGNENFEEVPGVPGPKRFVGVSGEYVF